jgi:hypothetical protein
MSYVVVAHIIGGLGNQMFQYATARRLAYKRKAPLKLDIAELELDTLRTYSLNHLSISAQFATPDECKELARRKPFYRKKTFIRERRPTYESRIKFKVPPVYLKGYWGSAKYFDDIAPLIRAEFEVSTPPSVENAAMLSEIGNASNPVAVHVRRGDYVGNTFHYSQPMEYYKEATARIRKVAEDARFYIFSDDPDWVKDNLKLPHEVVYVNHNNSDAHYEDLRLMRMCRHFIIANSTFSWWGAWLGDGNGKIVYAPSKWFNDPTVDISDLIPQGWIQI